MSEKRDEIRLLFVDDEVEFLKSASRALSRRGFVVTEAQNGYQALEILTRNQFDVVLLDQKMPGIDGVEVFRRIHKEYPELPVIILTGHGTVSSAFETAKSGISDYLSKPCETEEIVATIHQALKRNAPELSDRIASDEPNPEIHVVMIDDEVDLLTSLGKALRHRNIHVKTAETGEAGLELLEQTSADVIVLDVKMPGIDGLETLRRIKKKYPLQQVLLLTGHPNVTDAYEGVKRGAFDYVIKPPDVEELARKIRAAHRKRLDDVRLKQELAIRAILDEHPD